MPVKGTASKGESRGIVKDEVAVVRFAGAAYGNKPCQLIFNSHAIALVREAFPEGVDIWLRAMNDAEKLHILFICTIVESKGAYKLSAPLTSFRISAGSLLEYLGLERGKVIYEKKQKTRFRLEKVSHHGFVVDFNKTVTGGPVYQQDVEAAV